MKKTIIILSLIVFIFGINSNIFAAKVINKDNAALFSKKSNYATVIDGEQQAVPQAIIGNDDTVKDDYNVSGARQFTGSETEARFSVPRATKAGNKYTNTWSGYSITFEDDVTTAADYYDFYGEGQQYDFGISFKDYSRIAVYYSRLSRDLNIIAQNFAPKAVPNDVVVGGEVYKHVTDFVSYPFGTLIYDYYLRNVDGNLMIIECFHEKESDLAPTYINKFTKV